MCTNFVLIKSDGVAELADRLGVNANHLNYNENIGPGSLISIVTGPKDARELKNAVWWLFLEQTEEGLKPHNKYFSVNTNYAKLPKRPEYRTSRCIIPATAFVESQDGKNPYLLAPEDGSGIAFGGLYKTWTDKTTGEIVTSTSIITLPGHPALENIHRKSTPLWLPTEYYDKWLNPGMTDMSSLDKLLVPALRSPLLATPIDKVTKKNPVGEPSIVFS